MTEVLFTNEDQERLQSRHYLTVGGFAHLTAQDEIELWQDVKYRFSVWLSKAQAYAPNDDEVLSLATCGLPDCPMCAVAAEGRDSFSCRGCLWLHVFGRCNEDHDPAQPWNRDMYDRISDADQDGEQLLLIQLLSEVLARVDEQINLLRGKPLDVQNLSDLHTLVRETRIHNVRM